MTKKNKNYWQKRSEEIAQLQFDKADMFETEIAKEYRKAQQYIEDKINSYYARYSKDYGVSYAEAQKILTTSELDNFHMSLEEFIEKAKDNDDSKWSRELDREYFKSRISRLEALNTQVTSKLIDLGHMQENKAINTLSNVFSDTYYRNVFSFEKDLGMATNFARLNDETTKTAIYSKWLNGKNFSDRLWEDKNTLINSMNKIIRQGLIVGSSTNEMARNLTKTMNTSLNRARTLIQTETAYIHEKATTKAYKEFGVNEYEVVETLDKKTCDICGAVDGKHFKLSEKEEGVTAPPFHPRCRGTTVPITQNDDLFNEDSTRIARDNEDNTIEVSTNMTYNEWHKKYLENDKTENSKVETSTGTSEILKQLRNSGIEYNPVQKLKKPLTSDEIIQKVSGGDMTDGSCSSVAFVYAANRNGLDVLDFRGGESARYFARNGKIYEISQLTGVKSIVEEGSNDIMCAMKLLKQVEEGKEYYLGTGRHAAIVRRNEGKLQYLELQDEEKNGFECFTNKTLKKRFGCQQSHSRYGVILEFKNILIDIDSLKDNSEFEEILGYINTQGNKQMKGKNGYAK